MYFILGAFIMLFYLAVTTSLPQVGIPFTVEIMYEGDPPFLMLVSYTREQSLHLSVEEIEQIIEEADQEVRASYG